MRPLLQVALLIVAAAVARGEGIDLNDAATDAAQTYPASTIGSDGTFFIVWQDDRDGDDNLYGQSYHADGSPLWEAGGKRLIAAPRRQHAPEILPDAEGGFFLAWWDGRNLSKDLFAQRFDGAGKPVWQPADGVPIAVHRKSKDDHKIAPDGDGGYYLVWEDRRNDRLDIFGQHFDANGAALWEPNGAPICDTGGQKYDPFIAADGEGGLVVAWWDVDLPRWRVFAQRMSSAGARRWERSGVAVSLTEGNQAATTIIGDENGGAFVFWVDYRNDDGMQSNLDIYAQRIDADGNRLWGDAAKAVCDADGTQQIIDAISDGDGGALLTWTDQRDIFDDVYVQRIRADGSFAWETNGLPVCVEGGRQRDAKLALDGDRLWIAWYDYRREFENATRQDIYVQRMTLDGGATFALNGVPAVEDDSSRLSMQLHAAHGRAMVSWSEREDEMSESNARGWMWNLSTE